MKLNTCTFRFACKYGFLARANYDFLFGQNMPLHLPTGLSIWPECSLLKMSAQTYDNSRYPALILTDLSTQGEIIVTIVGTLS